MLTGAKKKRIIIFENLAVAIQSLNDVLDHINVCCNTCNQCESKKKTECDIARALNQAEKTMRFLRKASWMQKKQWNS